MDEKLGRSLISSLSPSSSTSTSTPSSSSEKSDRSDRADRSDRSDRADRSEKPDRLEHFRVERQAFIEKIDELTLRVRGLELEISKTRIKIAQLRTKSKGYEELCETLVNSGLSQRKTELRSVSSQSSNILDLKKK